MLMSSNDGLCGSKEDEFSRPVESIMRCEDFKSNFARRLSNRYITRSPLRDIKQDVSRIRSSDPKIHETENVTKMVNQNNSYKDTGQIVENVIVPEITDKLAEKAIIKGTEISALHIEVETLRWQLAQTEANRQMHLALLKQIVTFLTRIKEHMNKQEWPKQEVLLSKVLPSSFASVELPRSRSVLHVNKNQEYLITPPKKSTSKKISKSISNVNAFKEYSNWSQSKASLTSETNGNQKLTDEIVSIITLANTVLSTKIPDLACTCDDKIVSTRNGNHGEVEMKGKCVIDSKEKLDLIEENTATNVSLLRDVTCTINGYDEITITNKSVELKDQKYENKSNTPSFSTIELERDCSNINLINTRKQCFVENNPKNYTTNIKIVAEKKCENSATNFTEDESGFSSMNSFQEIGIPIINVCPPTPCKELSFIDQANLIIDPEDKCSSDALELEKQPVKVFWV